MVNVILIGMASGLAAALLFASVASGSLLSIVLFYLAPLPLMIAALGWGHVAGLIAALVASAGLAAVFGTWFLLVFLLGIGLPAWWLGYLALLARPAGTGPDTALEWFPIGRLVVWSAVLGTLIVAIAIPTFGTNAESFEAGLKGAFERLLRSESETGPDAPLSLPGLSDPDRLLDFLVAVVPPTAAVVATITTLVNLWLAGKIVKVSGRLRRPWPDFKTMTLPRIAAWLLGGGIAGSFLPGLAGTVAGMLTCTMLIAYALLGFAVLHTTTLGINGRGLVLATTYAVVVVFGWPVLLMTLLGLTDTVVDIRGRVARRRGASRPSP